MQTRRAEALTGLLLAAPLHEKRDTRRSAGCRDVFWPHMDLYAYELWVRMVAARKSIPSFLCIRNAAPGMSTKRYISLSHYCVEEHVVQIAMPESECIPSELNLVDAILYKIIYIFSVLVRKASLMRKSGLSYVDLP